MRIDQDKYFYTALTRGLLSFGFILIFFLSGYSQEQVNIFSDPVIRKIHDYADRRDSTALLTYLSDSNPNYQGEALMCLGSVQAVSLIDTIAVSFASEMNGIRMAAAFALGQTYHPDAASILRDALSSEKVKLVRGMMFDALGKTGDMEDLKWLAGRSGDYQEAEGQVQGILRFGMRGINSDEANDRVLKIMQEGTSTVGLIYSSYHLGRYADTAWLSKKYESLEALYRDETDPLIGSNLIPAIIKGRGEQAGPTITTLLTAENDYREKVNTLRSIIEECWGEVSKEVFKLVESDSPNISVAAAETVSRLAGEDDLAKIIKTADKIENWRSRALIIVKAYELTIEDKARSDLEEKISGYIINSENPAERALLISAYGVNPDKFEFVSGQLKSLEPVIRTSAMQTIVDLASIFKDKIPDEMTAEERARGKQFLEVFKDGIKSMDIALVSLSASVFRNPDLPFSDMLTDYGFMEEALERAIETPSLAEARNELEMTLASLKEEEHLPSPPKFNHEIDWEKVVKIPARQLIGIVTSKGDIVVQLNVRWCPGTVSAFLELVESGFYDGRTIHRVVPNFVVQDGCPRGDGWGGPPFTIRSEFTPAPFLEGVVGMASAGKDTEGSQWYFTHTATPHLDGKYTNFGKVVEGIEVVHQLELGDEIKRIVVLD